MKDEDIDLTEADGFGGESFEDVSDKKVESKIKSEQLSEQQQLLQRKLKRIARLIDAGEFDDAKERIEKIEQEEEDRTGDCEISLIYHYKMLIDYNVSSDAELISYLSKNGVDISKNKNYRLAKGYADDADDEEEFNALLAIKKKLVNGSSDTEIKKPLKTTSKSKIVEERRTTEKTIVKKAVNVTSSDKKLVRIAHLIDAGEFDDAAERLESIEAEEEAREGDCAIAEVYHYKLLVELKAHSDDEVVEYCIATNADVTKNSNYRLALSYAKESGNQKEQRALSAIVDNLDKYYAAVKAEAERKAKAEAERKRKEKERKEAELKAEAERKAKEEAERKAKAAAERKAKAEAALKAKKEEEERLAKAAKLAAEASKVYDKKPEEAYELASQALKTDKNNAVAQTVLGMCYQFGNGVTLNIKTAVHWYTEAAAQGIITAQINLAKIYDSGYVGVRQNYAEALKWYKKAADQGDASAQYNVALFYEKGKGVAENDEEAAKWYTKAAEQNYVPAQTGLANMYYQGHGVRKDYASALKWYKKAAANGYCKAQSGVADCYFYGNGTEQDYTEAINWYKKAAKGGDAYAQYCLGMCCYNGNGVPQNEDEAEKWFKLSHKNGYEKAATALKDLKEAAAKKIAALRSQNNPVTLAKYRSYQSTVYFGAYPQSKKPDDVIITPDTFQGNNIGSDGFCYKLEKGVYYRIEPIEWKVCGGFLIPTKILDCKPFNVKEKPFSYNNQTYRISDIRTWLTKSFLIDAYLYSQSKDIADTYLGDNCSDKVFILEERDIQSLLKSVLIKQGTDYAKAHNLWTAPNGNSGWLLRTPSKNNYIKCVWNDGTLHDVLITYAACGVVPALKLK